MKTELITRITILALACGLGSSLVNSTAGAQSVKVEIWTARDAQLGSLPIIAQKKGFLKEKGVDAQVRFVSSGNEIPAGMAGGTIPIAVASYTNPMAMAANGVPVRILAQTADVSGALQLTVRSEAGIRVPKDLEGKKLGMTRIPLMMALLEAGCAAYGCDVSKITIVNMQPQDLVLGYERGNIDAVLTNEPWSIYTQQKGGKFLFSATQSAVPGQEGARRIDGIYAAVFARPDWVDKNPQVTKSILQAFVQAADWIRGNAATAAEIIGQEINIPTDVVAGTLKKVDNRLSMTAEWGNSFNEKAAYLLKIGELRGKVIAKDVYFPGPLQSVCAECVTFK